MYPSLRENQAWAQSAAEESSSTRQSSRSTDATLQMNGPRHSPPANLHGSRHQSSSSHSSLFRRPVSNGYNSVYYNAVYYPNYRVHDNRPPSSIISPHHITHLFYAFAACDFDGTVRLSDDKADSLMDVDGVSGGLQACLALRAQNPNLRVILSIGGPKGSEAFKYVAPNKALRQVFCHSLRTLVTRYGLNGIDVFWDTPRDAAECSDLLSLLAAIKGYLPNSTSFVTLPGDQKVLERIELDQLPEYADFINLRTYDFSCGMIPHQSCHHAQLLASTLPGSPTSSLSCQSAIAYLDACKVPLRRVLMGVPCYGRGFVGATGPGQPYTEIKEIPYSDLPPTNHCDTVDTVVGAAHRIDGTTWISYDCANTVRTKADFVKMRRLAGLFYWEATEDKRGPESLVWNGYDALRSSG